MLGSSAITHFQTKKKKNAYKFPAENEHRDARNILVSDMIVDWKRSDSWVQQREIEGSSVGINQ